LKEVQKQKNSAESSIMFAFMATGRGIGNVVSGPISEKLSQDFSGATLTAGRMVPATAL
jgi:hypothetical protein